MNLASVSSFPPLQLMVVPLRSLPPVSVRSLGGLRDRKGGLMLDIIGLPLVVYKLRSVKTCYIIHSAPYKMSSHIRIWRKT